MCRFIESALCYFRFIEHRTNNVVRYTWAMSAWQYDVVCASISREIICILLSFGLFCTKRTVSVPSQMQTKRAKKIAGKISVNSDTQPMVGFYYLTTATDGWRNCFLTWKWRCSTSNLFALKVHGIDRIKSEKWRKCVTLELDKQFSLLSLKAGRDFHSAVAPKVSLIENCPHLIASIFQINADNSRSSRWWRLNAWDAYMNEHKALFSCCMWHDRLRVMSLSNELNAVAVGIWNERRRRCVCLCYSQMQFHQISFDKRFSLSLPSIAACVSVWLRELWSISSLLKLIIFVFVRISVLSLSQCYPFYYFSFIHFIECDILHPSLSLFLCFWQILYSLLSHHIVLNSFCRCLTYLFMRCSRIFVSDLSATSASPAKRNEQKTHGKSFGWQMPLYTWNIVVE